MGLKGYAQVKWFPLGAGSLSRPIDVHSKTALFLAANPVFIGFLFFERREMGAQIIEFLINCSLRIVIFKRLG